MAMVCRGGALKGGLVELVEAACRLVEAAEDERVQHQLVRHCHGTQTPQRVRSTGENAPPQNAPPQRAHAPCFERGFFFARRSGVFMAVLHLSTYLPVYLAPSGGGAPSLGERGFIYLAPPERTFQGHAARMPDADHPARWVRFRYAIAPGT